MKLPEIYLIFAVLINLSHQSPLGTEKIEQIDNFPKEFQKLDESTVVQRPRAETKNWKINSNFYSNNSHSKKLLDNPPTTYRLPNDTLPVRYDIQLETFVHESNFNFYGRVKIHIRAVDVTNVVTLQHRDMTISKVSLIAISNEEVLVDELNFEYIEFYEFLKIQLPQTLQVDDEIRLRILFNGTLNTNDAGFYRAFYTSNGEIVNYAVTQFESTDARHAFPCYDEPAIRAPMALQIQHHKSYNAYSNMPLIEKIPIEGNDFVISKFEETPPMQTYLLAFIVAPFDAISNNAVDIPQRILAKPSSIANGSADFAVSIADPIIRTLINLFGVNYTLPKLDHAAITQFAAGAMENWGLVTYREQYLLFTSTNNSARDEQSKRDIIATMAHEDAHQFFGNLVAPHWWSDLWLNEGFATLYEYYIPHLIYPNDGWMEEFRVTNLYFSFMYDNMLFRLHPMHNYIENPIEIDGMFDFVSYTKASVVLNMFQEALGVSTFIKGLKMYLNKMAYKAAVPNDLFTSLQNAFDEDYPGNKVDIPKIMATWVYQSGYPLVEVTKDDNGYLTFKQRRFPESAGEIYSIPISYATADSPDFENKKARIWLTEAVTSIHQNELGMSDEDWVIFNIQQTGYYRVAYSSELWQAIAIGLQKDYSKVHTVNRRILQTELTLGYSELDNIYADDVLEVLSYLVDEPEYLLWSDASTLLRSLNRTLFGTIVYPEYLNFMKTITRKQLGRVGMEAVDREPIENAYLRNEVKTFNCYALDEDCLDHELKKLILYREFGFEVPDFCSAFRHAPFIIYNYYLNELASNKDLPYRSRILSSIGCALDEDMLRIVSQVAESTLSINVITDQERVSIFNNMMISSPSGLKVALEYLERNLHTIGSYFDNLGRAINTRENYEKVKQMLDQAVSEGFVFEVYAQGVLDEILNNLKWQDKHFNSILRWFGHDVEETTVSKETTVTTQRSPTTQSPTTTPGSAGGIVSSAVFVFVCILGQIIGY